MGKALGKANEPACIPSPGKKKGRRRGGGGKKEDKEKTYLEIKL